jgi:hypothetical protein
MRALISILFAYIPIFAGTMDTSSVTCNGVVYQGADLSCGSQSEPGPYASNNQSTLMAEAWGSSSASATFIQTYVLTVTGGLGDGFAEPILQVSGDRYVGVAGASASASFGGCELYQSGEGPPMYCYWNSVPFAFGVPQTITLSLSADAWSIADAPPVGSLAMWNGLNFFDTEGQPLSGINYSLDEVFEQTPEPATLSLLMGMACVAIFVIDGRRRQSR